MRTLLFLLISASAAFSQPLSFGLKAGVPLTDFFSTVQSSNFGFNSSTKRYVIGPTIELHLPAGFGIEFDALYRRFDYTGAGTPSDGLQPNRTHGNSWEFPLLLKYKPGRGFVRPFVDGGVAFNTLQGVKQTITSPGSLFGQSTSNPAELQNDTTAGVVLGGGIELRVPFLRISPEIRYTRWGSRQFLSPGDLLQSNRNQAEFLLGITF